MQTILTETEQRLADFREQGYTIFRNVYSKQDIAQFREEFYLRKKELYGDEIRGNYLVSGMIERNPQMMMPVTANPLILDFAEKVMGPFLQISDTVLFGFDSVPADESQNRVNGWHRDRYAHVPRGGYTNPAAVSVLSYLQDMTAEAGPLRVIPGSHRNPVVMSREHATIPHPDEQVVTVQAGDVVFFHNALLHTGSPNITKDLRIFIGGGLNCTWMKSTDDHSGPNSQRLIAEARERNDHRILRLFGIDEQLEKRINSGFIISDDTRWAEWAAEDRAAVKGN